MNMHLYPKLAWHGIIKNKKTYVPFLLTSIGLVMMFYIVSYLTYNKSVKQMRGGGDMQLILSWGVPVVAFFVVIFLFYMNSFLMRRRKTEFGLYNILGMGKGNIARVLLWQNLMLFVVSIVGGLGMGILLSKLAELCAAKMLSNQASLAFVIEPSAVRNTLFLTVLSFVLILLYSLGQIRVAKPIELLHGEKTGEKPPKARWILALLGMLLLGTAYYLALTTKDPIQALLVLFIAIVLVIIASYLLFICGSNTAFGRFWIETGFPLIFSPTACVIAAVVVAFPLMYRNALGAFESLDRNMLDAARTLGWSNAKIFVRLMLPLSWSSIAAGMVLAFARALGEFGATLFMAGNYVGVTRTIPIAIYFEWMNGNSDVAWFWTGVIIVFSLVVIVFINLWSGHTTKYRKRSE